MNLENKRVSCGEPASQSASAVIDTAHIYGKSVNSEQPLGVLMEAMRNRLEALRDPRSPAAMAELQRTMPTLEALYIRFSAEAANSRQGAAHKTLLLRAALQAQQAYARTFALQHTLALQARNSDRTTVTLQPEVDEHGRS